METVKELAQSIIDFLECGNRELCVGCSMEGIDCDERLEVVKRVLLNVIAGAEQKNDVSRETAESNTALPPEPDKASEYITITVAEYHFLTKMATLLDTILAAEQYNPKPTVDAVRTVVAEMIQQHEAGAAE